MPEKLNGKTIAILATNGFEQSELEEPKKALEAAGAKTQVVSINQGQIRGWHHTDWGNSVPVDVTIEQANPDEYDGLVLPGGVINPDKLRMDPGSRGFRAELRAIGQAHRRDLPRAVDVDQRGRRARPQDDVVAVAAGGPGERGGALGGSAGGGRSGPGHQPKAR